MFNGNRIMKTEMTCRAPSMLAMLVALFFSMIPMAFAETGGYGAFPGNPAVYSGFVYARTQVVNENGNLIWVQYNATNPDLLGEVVPNTEIEATNDFHPSTVQVYAISDFNNQVQRYNDTIEVFQNAGHSTENTLITAEEYDSQSFTDQNNQTLSKPLLNRDTIFVLLRPQSDRYLGNQNVEQQVVAQEFSIDPREQIVTATGQGSVLVNSVQGTHIANTVTEHRWAILTAFYYDPDSKSYESPESDRDKAFVYSFSGNQDDILKPLSGVDVEVSFTETSKTNNKGYFRVPIYSPGCYGPGASYSYQTYVIAKLPYTRFNPKLADNPGYYFQKRIAQETCIGTPVSSRIIYSGSKSTLPKPINFPVDITMLSGVGSLRDLNGNKIPVNPDDQPTTYSVSAQPIAELDEYYAFDFDHDGENDQVVKGTMQPVPAEEGEPQTDETYFVPDSVNDQLEGDKLWGVYLAASGKDIAEDQPDFTKVMDLEANLEHEGLLESISEADLADTDMYVVRLSDGSIISERIGLSRLNDELLSDPRYQGYLDADDNWIIEDDLATSQETDEFTYRMEIRGESNFVEGSFDAFSRNSRDWQTAMGLDLERFGKAEADHVKPGELIKIYLINRATGYMGSQKVKVESASAAGGSLTFRINEIKMTPPNLKIWVERDYTIDQGLTKDENRNYTIGSEGAALVDDTKISVYTEWLDQDGSYFPASMQSERIGFTGRIVHLVGPKKLPGNSNSVNHFSIQPGKHIEVLTLPQKWVDNHHYYLQVSGQPKHRTGIFGGDGNDGNFVRIGEPDFEPGTHTGKLQNRPAKFVPFKVPVFDEQFTEVLDRSYREDLEAGNQNAVKPDPYYHDLYRPEFQFTIYDLEMREINREIGGEAENILESEQPIIAGSDDAIELLYSLTLQNAEFDPLDYLNINDEKELIFALGEQEIKATIGSQGNVTFDNLEHLASLDSEDILSLRLYTNNDSANILWEYAFHYLTMEVGVDPIRYADEIYVNADEPTLDLTAFLYGTGSDEEKNWHSYQLIWKVEEGDAQITPTISSLREGAARATLNISPFANNEVTISAALVDSPDTKVLSQKIRVLDGMPASVVVTEATGDVYEQGIGQRDITVRVFDANNNPLKSGIPVSFITEGGAYISNQVVTTDNNGYASATVKGSYDSGAFPVNISAGANAETTSAVSVNPISINFNSLPSSLVGGNVYDLSVEATASGAAPDAFVQLGATGAILEQQSFKTDESGLLSYRLHVPPKGGDIRLSARTSIDTVVYEVLQAQPKDETLSAERTFILANQQDAQYEALQTDQITLKGNDGESWSLDFDQHHFPNRAPIYLNRFFDLRNDEAGLYAAQYSASRSTDKPAYGFYSVNFVESDAGERNWRLPYADALDVSRPGISFWLKVETDGTVLSASDNRVELTVNNGTLSADITTIDGTVQLSQAGITTGAWHQVALGLNGTQAYLAIDGQSDIQATTSTINWNEQVGDPWLTLGDKPNSNNSGFEGKVSGFRLYDWSAPALVTLSQTSGVFDATGTETISVVSTGQAIPVNTSVGLTTASNETLSINLLPWNNFNRYQGAVTRVLGAQETLADNVTLSPLFPTADQPLESLHTAVSARDDMGPLEAVLVATAWLGMRNEISVIEPHIAALQDSYETFGDQQLVFALADELAQAISEAKAGNNMRLITMRTGLLVWGELLAESPSAAQFIGSATQNKTDLWTWLRYMSLPANGWAGEHIPIPRPEMTCDKVTPTVNVGTILEYSDVPCRATGAMVADAINNWIAEDEDISTNHRLLTRYIEVMTSGLKGAPLELTKLVFATGSRSAVASNWLPVKDAHANPLAVAARLLVFALKTGAKAGFSTAPQNLINFFQNKTTSRFDAIPLLASIAYLESRRDGGVFACEGCPTINDEVFEQIDNNLIRWFNGLSLANNGTLQEESLRRKVCTLSNQAHGAALELVGTAAYHSLFEFANRSDLEILASDKYIRVPLRERDGTEYYKVGAGDYGRQPDLILKGAEGDARESRYWIEFKSWKKGQYFSRGKLKDKAFKPWDLTRDVKSQFPHAHKQHFLDYVATAGELRDVWQTDIATTAGSKTIELVENLSLRAASNRTWIQTWEQYDEAREYQVFEKVDNSWRVRKKTIPVYRATPWINTNGIVNNTQIRESQFDLIQEYLTQAPDMRDKAFRATVGYSKGNHHQEYAEQQIGNSGGTVAPFTLMNMLAVEVGEATARETINKLTEQVAGSEFANYLGGGELTAEQIESLRAQVEAQVLENMGVIGAVLEAANTITPDWWLSIEESMQDAIAGAIGDDAREVLANFTVPELLEEQLCETLEE